MMVTSSATATTTAIVTVLRLLLLLDVDVTGLLCRGGVVYTTYGIQRSRDALIQIEKYCK